MGPYYQRLAIGIVGLAILVVLVISRMRMPEFIRWLERKGRIEDAIREVRKYYSVNVDSHNPLTTEVKVSTQIPHPPFWFRFVVAALMVTANDLGFGLLAYEVEPIYFPSRTSLIVLITTLAEFIAGLLIVPFADGVSRKVVLLFSTGGSAVITYIIVALMRVITSDFALFLAMDTFKGELWLTERRGMFISFVRLISIGSLIPETLWAVTAPLS